MSERDYWNGLFATVDPWNYASEYEQQKYRHTLELLPDSRGASAVEVGCAEGVFTEMLAPRVDRLLAIDISDAALQRARVRCASKPNVEYRQHDISGGMIGSGYDLVVCSEILYYLRDRAAIEKFAGQVAGSLNPGGHVLMTHANIVSDDRTQTGFDFNEVGALTFGEIFSSRPELEFIRELRTDLYRVQLFRRVDGSQGADASGNVARGVPREVLIRKNARFEHPTIKWGGCAVTAAEAKHCWVAPEVPILMYHRIASDGPAKLAPYRVSAASFERQLAWLQRYGYRGMSLDDYFEHRFKKGVHEFPGKPVVITFDDAYADFYECAWPLLEQYGFGATVFVPTDYVGGTADWDGHYGTPARIMSWNQITELSKYGVSFGSHSCSHRRLSQMTREEVLDEAVRSKRILEAKLGVEIAAYCYPYASADPECRTLIEQSSYRFAVCGRGGDPPARDNPFYIPRLEIFGHDSIESFIARLPAPRPADPATQSKYFELKSRRDRATYMGR